MTHRHEWNLETLYPIPYCDECDNWMSDDEIERRLNATEYLSADDAQEHASDLYYDKETEIRDCPFTWEEKMIEILRNYAKTLRGE